ncbi:MoaD/ThiS family protein [Christensenellaceae bacterium OttesenSCG-928-L17]|nr:MoaD/ThiS family protein [Christensenellaceae bacterium OttesenSCG-928-L17]
MVTLKYWGSLMELTGKRSECVEAQTLAEVLAFLERTYGKECLKQAKRMLIAVDGTNIQLLSRYKTSLKGGQTVSFLPLSGGG